MQLSLRSQRKPCADTLDEPGRSPAELDFIIGLIEQTQATRKPFWAQVEMRHERKVFAQHEDLWHPLIIGEEQHSHLLGRVDIVNGVLPPLNRDLDDDYFGVVGRLLAQTQQMLWVAAVRGA